MLVIVDGTLTLVDGVITGVLWAGPDVQVQSSSSSGDGDSELSEYRIRKWST